jgi:O-antigen biosynthesis protein
MGIETVNRPPAQDRAAARAGDDESRLAELLEQARRSARMHAIRADILRNEADFYAAQAKQIRASTSWKLTWPLRRGLMAARAILHGLRRRAHGALHPEAVRAEAEPIAHWLHGRPVAPKVDAAYLVPPPRPAGAVLAPRVLIIAELSIPQCAKYRVWQKKEMLAQLGIQASVVDWRRVWDCLSAIQLHARIIFYRVPATPEMRGMVREAQRLGIETSWEVDDLIFDESLYVENRNLTTLDADLRREVLSGVKGYRGGLLACDSAIASTAPLAEAMHKVTGRPALVVENALDSETLEAAALLRATRAPQADGSVLIAYGSGTKTHDVDFLQVADALAAVMRARPHVRLRIVGELTIPPVLDAFADRIERLPPVEYRAYLARLSEADISLAPLEPTLFNDAKSNIKFLEAAILAMASVSSPRACFRAVVRDGETGFLAEGEQQWHDALLRLVDDPALRARMGAAALADALDRYAPESIAARQVAPLVRDLDQRQVAPLVRDLDQRQVAPLVRDLDQHQAGRLRVLVVNVYYPPQRFGGATIVAEELTRRLAVRPDTDVTVFTTHQLPDHPNGALFRYEIDGVPVIAARQPPAGDRVLEFDNPLMAETFAQVLAATEPDVVHFHCVQHVSASCVEACREAGIPYLVTLHDAWWLCERQFMVMEDGRYCHQWQIDLSMCERCIPRANYLRDRFAALQTTLDGAARLVAPSEFHRLLHVANGHAPERVTVNKNGVQMPLGPRPPRAPGALRFGYVGGNETVKGVKVIRGAFAALASRDYELVLVDNTLNLGFSTWEEEPWELPGKVTIVPAYTRDTMDAFFAGIDVLLFPSQWKESFGLTVREALARDVWVIATDAGGVVEEVVDGVNGTIIPMDGDPEKLRDAIAALLAEPARLRAYSNPLKDRIATFESQADHMRGLLAEAAGHHA